MTTVFLRFLRNGRSIHYRRKYCPQIGNDTVDFVEIELDGIIFFVLWNLFLFFTIELIVLLIIPSII